MPKIACHCVITRGDRLLMLQRIKPPYVGKWVVPGGKLEPDEYWIECAHRELREETGLAVETLTPAVLLHERSDSPDWQWLIMMVRGESHAGELINGGDGPEGKLVWQSIADLPMLDCSPVDRWLYQRILSSDFPGFEAINLFFPAASQGDYEQFEVR